jgi:hypothetical protein
VSHDIVIRNGRWFAGSGGPSAQRNLGIRDGRVVAITPHELDATDCPLTVGAAGTWVMPGVTVGIIDLLVVDPARLDASLDDYAGDRVEQYGGLARWVGARCS